MLHVTKTFLLFIAFQGPRKKESTQENTSPTPTIVAAVVSVAGVAILIAIAVFCWRRYRGFYVTLRYLTKCRRYSNLLRWLISLSSGNDVMKISIFPSCSKSGHRQELEEQSGAFVARKKLEKSNFRTLTSAYSHSIYRSGYKEI